MGTMVGGDEAIDEQVFWARWAAELPYFKKLCERWLYARPHDVDDVLSVGALKAISYLRLHPGEVRRFRPWAQRLLHNLCVDLLRSQRRVVELIEDDPLEVYGVAIEWGPQDRDLCRRELARELERALIALPPRLRAAFDMRFHDDLSYAEISERLAISQENARKRIQQARGQLRRELAAHTR